MFDLKCKRIGCEFNEDCNCTAKNVQVTHSTKCDTYKPSKDKREENLKNIEELEKVPRPPVRKNIEVGCQANCIFNENSECSANGITVQTCDDKTCPNCMTFMPK